MNNFCSNCGSALAADVNFCPKCGRPTSSSSLGAGISSDEPTSLASSLKNPVQIPSTNYGSHPYGATLANPYEPLNPYETSLPPPPPPRRHVKLTLLIGLVVLVLVLVSGGVFAFLTRANLSHQAQHWYDGNYVYKKKITIDHSKVSGGSNLSNFPVLISMTDVSLKTAKNGGNVQNSNGYDIIFVDSAETAKLDYEIEKYVATTGEIDMWVKIPTLSASSDTVIYMYYDNSTITSSQENKTGVWDSNYQGVWHLKETSGTQNDSTSNNRNSIAVNVTTEGATAGQIDGADSFNGSSNYVQINGLMGSPSSVTLSGWANSTSSASSAEMVSLGDHVAIRIENGSNFTNYTGFYFDGSGWRGVTSSTNYDDTGWHYLVFTIDGVAHTQTIYVDGVQKGQVTNTQPIVYSGLGTNTFIGRHGNGNAYYFKGSIDEIRVSTSVRSAGWIATEYNNQFSPSTFYIVGPATTLST